MAEPTRDEDQISEGYLVALNSRMWSLSLGLLFGFLLFAATNILVLKGGEHVGSHLKLLAEYLPLYRVTFLGSLIGFFYAFAIGFVSGRILCFVYNRLLRRS